MTEEQSLRRAGCHPWRDETLTRSPDCMPVHAELSTAFCSLLVLSQDCVALMCRESKQHVCEGVGLRNSRRNWLVGCVHRASARVYAAVLKASPVARLALWRVVSVSASQQVHVMSR